MPSSIFPAIQNLLLAAGALGLGSALTTIATAFADELRDAVGLPETVVPVAVVPLGVPARPLGPPRREPVRRAHPPRPLRHPLDQPSTAPSVPIPVTVTDSAQTAGRARCGQ